MDVRIWSGANGETFKMTEHAKIIIIKSGPTNCRHVHTERWNYDQLSFLSSADLFRKTAHFPSSSTNLTNTNFWKGSCVSRSKFSLLLWKTLRFDWIWRIIHDCLWTNRYDVILSFGIIIFQSLFCGKFVYLFIYVFLEREKEREREIWKIMIHDWSSFVFCYC